MTRLKLRYSGLQPFRRWEVKEEAWLRSSGDERAEEQLRPDLQKRLTANEKQVAKAILRCSPPYHQDLRHIDRDGM